MFDPQRPLRGFLADTWWYGLTGRISDQQFQKLAYLRQEQGFSAVQLVVGIPPEVGPENENAAGPHGPAWTLDRSFNKAYLQWARQRIKKLNRSGLGVIVYGAWGHQINWLGRSAMVAWWRAIIDHLDDCDVIYCLTGESNLWIGRENLLLPDLSTTDIKSWQPPLWLPGRLRAWTVKVLSRLQRVRSGPASHQKQERKEGWSFVLQELNIMTSKPLIIHTNYLEKGLEAVNNPHLLHANTTQTGHSGRSRRFIWQLPMQQVKERPALPFINLEPWYEGIRDQFYTHDQLFAYWSSMLAGAAAFCYGAHGIWNGGDGRFLAHWGRQTFEQALQLKSPNLLGQSHKLFLSLPHLPSVSYEMDGSQLKTISRRDGRQHITFLPQINTVARPPQGKIWLPLQGVHAPTLPQEGPVVIYDVNAHLPHLRQDKPRE